MKTFLAQFVVLFLAVLGSPTFGDIIEDKFAALQGTGGTETALDDNNIDGGAGDHNGAVHECNEKPIRLDDDEKELIEQVVDGLAKLLPAVGQILKRIENESKDALEDFLELVKQRKEREAVKVVGAHFMKIDVNFQRMIAHALKYANESGLLDENNSSGDDVEGLEDELEYDSDVLEQAQELVRRAKDGNCDDIYVRMGVNTALSGMRFYKNAWILKQKLFRDLNDLQQDIDFELKQCNMDDAKKLVGNAALSYMRRVMKIILLLHKINPAKPRPSKAPLPSKGQHPSEALRPSEGPLPPKGPRPSRGPRPHRRLRPWL